MDESSLDASFFEGGAKVEEITPEETEQQKGEKKAKDAAAGAKAKEILGGYIKKYKGIMIAGFILQLAGMVGEFASPLFIGMVVDAISNKDMDRVKQLVVYWLIINSVSNISAFCFPNHYTKYHFCFFYR